MNNYYQCIEILNKYDLKPNSRKLLSDQIQEIIQEMEASYQEISPEEIVFEVFAANDIVPKFIKEKVLDLKFNTTGREITLTDEGYTKINMRVRLGGANVDLTNYQFIANQLVINANVTMAGIELLISPDVRIIDESNSTMGGNSYRFNGKEYHSPNEISLTNFKNKIILCGKSKLGGIAIRYQDQPELLTDEIE